jgi:protein involved in polysaccharide export with SLBB domain
MNPGEGRSSWRDRLACHPLPAILFCALCVGCATDRANVEKNLRADRQSVRRSEGVAEHYLLGCPDALEIRIRNRPELSGQAAVDATGSITLADYAPVRVEGRTLPEVARLVAAETGEHPDEVDVRVVAFRSQFLFLSGQIVGWQRTVPYQGQETVLDLLQRIGGITSGADVADVYVLRSHMGDIQRPEVFYVNLKAIVLNHEEKTNIRLMPFDQVHVGESRPAQLEKAFPPWLRPAYQAFWNILPDSQRPAPSPASRWVAGM